jgi:hypothetical protein
MFSLESPPIRFLDTETCRGFDLRFATRTKARTKRQIQGSVLNASRPA